MSMSHELAIAFYGNIIKVYWNINPNLWCPRPAALARHRLPGRHDHRSGRWLSSRFAALHPIRVIRLSSCWTQPLENISVDRVKQRVSGQPNPWCTYMDIYIYIYMWYIHIHIYIYIYIYVYTYIGENLVTWNLAMRTGCTIQGEPLV